MSSNMEGSAKPGTATPYSKVAISGNLVAVSGQVPLDAEGNLVSDDFRTQAERVFTNLEECLATVGCTVADVFKVTGYLSNLTDLEAYNQIYATRFSEPFPARTTVQSGLLGMKIEVEAWARLPSEAVAESGQPVSPAGPLSRQRQDMT